MTEGVLTASYTLAVVLFTPRVSPVNAFLGLPRLIPENLIHSVLSPLPIRIKPPSSLKY